MATIWFSGVVDSDRGLAVPSATIIATFYSGSGAILSTDEVALTDAAGEYLFSVNSEDRGGISAVAIGVKRGGSTNITRVEPNATHIVLAAVSGYSATANFVAFLENYPVVSYSIAGYVTNSVGGSGVPGITLELQGRTSSAPVAWDSIIDTTTTSSTGKYTFTFESDAPLYVRVVPSPDDAFISYVESYRIYTPLLTNYVGQDFVATPAPDPSIRGYVLDNGGEPIVDARVELWTSIGTTSNSFGSKISEAITDDQGAYILFPDVYGYVVTRLMTDSITDYLSPISPLYIHYRPFVNSLYNQDFSVALSPPPVVGGTTTCLTTSVASGKGTITQPGCPGPRGPDETYQSCASNFEIGSSVQLTSAPDDSNGWVISDWHMHLSASPYTEVTGYFNVPTAGAVAVVITMPAFDVDVTVTFTHPNVTLVLSPQNDGGCIQLVSPTGSSYNNLCRTVTNNQSIPVGDITSAIVTAIPDPGYEILAWTIDNVSAGSGEMISVPLEIDATATFVRVWFTGSPPCNTNTLNITIVGRGSLNRAPGEYCDDQILRLTPSPAFGYFFKGWGYNDDEITEDGIVLVVPMSSDRSVTAIFELSGTYEPPEGELFYCPSTTDKNNIVSFDFSNVEGNPSAYSTFHFRVSFYSDSSKQKLLYSAFSLSDTKRWFYNDTYFEPILSGGVDVLPYATINIVYDPEILPQQVTETQSSKLVSSGVYESPLVCGVKYHVEVESYNSTTATFSFVEAMSLILDCEEVDSYYWDYNGDDNNWLCSGQGKTDLQVSSSSNSQSIFTAVSSNLHGLYQIVWQTRRDGVFQVYGAVWDSDADVLYSSGQGGYDKLQLFAGYRPVVLTDQANNFYITGHVTQGETNETLDTDIYVNACTFPVSLEDTPTETSSDLFVKLCAPGIAIYLDSSYDQIKARVYQEDVAGSLVVNANKVVPIINKKSIRLDIDGIDGAYAVRLRNINDPDWGGWINIDSNLYYEGAGLAAKDNDFITSEDVSYDAYRIDNSRFIVPWNVDKINGLRRVCCQVLTLYGITNVFCLDLFFNFDIPRHVFKFYTAASRLPGSSTDVPAGNEFPVYNGRYVLSLKDEDGVVQTANDETTVYFTVVFSEPVYKNESTSPPESYGIGDLMFNVVQQGINDLWGSPLTPVDDKNFNGEFVIHREDGIFNKDGDSFIEIIFPGANRSSLCLSDSSDRYNLMITNEQAAEYKDLTPEEVYNKIQTDHVGKTLEPNQFKQYYDQDDDNFKFGNPGYFRE